MTDLHFVASYVCLRTFLSVFDKNITNIVLCTNIDIYKFLQQIIPKAEIIYIEENTKTKKFYKELLTQINKYKNISIHYYCDKYTIIFFIIINRLRRLHTVYFFDCEPRNLYSNEMLGLDFNLIKIYAKKILLYIKYGISLAIVKHKNGKYILHYNKDIDQYASCTILSWESILDKFEMQKYRLTGSNTRSLLYIHQGLNADIVRKEKNNRIIVDCLLKYQSDGYQIFIKGHPSHDLERIYLENNFYIIPQFIPVEIIEPTFNLYLTVYSLGILPFICHNTAFSLINYLELDNKEKIKLFINENLKGLKLLQ